MKKVLIGLLVLVAIIAIAATVLVSNLDGLIKETIETEGTAAIGAKVSVEAVETDLRAGTAMITGMSIANVPGYQQLNAIEISTLKADVDYQNQLIEEILIEQPVINAELVGTRSNFQDLLDNMPATEPMTQAEIDAMEAAAAEGEPTEITINSIKLNGATVNLTSDQLGQRSFVMDDLEITGLSGTPEYISEVVTQRLTQHITKQVTGYATEEIKARIAEEAKKQVEGKVNEVVNDAIQNKLGDKVKGLKLKLGTN